MAVARNSVEEPLDSPGDEDFRSAKFFYSGGYSTPRAERDASLLKVMMTSIRMVPEVAVETPTSAFKEAPTEADDDAVSLLHSSKLSGELDYDDLVFSPVNYPSHRTPFYRRCFGFLLKRPLVGVMIFAAIIILLVAGRSAQHLPACHNILLIVPTVADMSLKEKLGQMIMASMVDLNNGKDISTYFLGAVTSQPGEHPRSGASAKDWADMTSLYQARALSTRLRIPIIYGVEANHGHGSVYGATIFPHAIGLGATGNHSLLQLVAFAVAEEMAATGIRWNLGPMLSTCLDPRWGRCYECFSESKHLVSALNTQLTGFSGDPTSLEKSETRRELVATCGKFFYGAGGTASALTSGDTEGSDAFVRSLDFLSFFDARVRGINSFMLNNGSINGSSVHGNPYFANTLRKQLGFEGPIVSAHGGLKSIPGSWVTQVRRAVNAGIDMIQPGPGQYLRLLQTLETEVKEGRISEHQVDAAVQRILRMKIALGLFESPCSPGPYELALDSVGSAQHRQIAKEAVRQSLVLLKDGGNGRDKLLPLETRGKTYYLTGSHADNLGYQCGGWTLSVQGSGGRITIGTTVREAFETILGSSAELIYELQPSSNISAHYGVVIIGEAPYAETPGDEANQPKSKSLQLDSAARTTISTVCSSMPCILVLITGRPLIVEDLLELVHTLVVAWLPGTEGLGIAEVLLQEDLDFTGVLPVTWPKSVSQLPYPDSQDGAPLFPFGYGLTKNGSRLQRPKGHH
eukprot:SM000302S11653  [mRNA]  locus=s302:108908:113649:+ [translate_table: standard]